MKDLSYVLENFFTHKDYLVEAELIPGTIFTPLHFIFEALLLLIIFSSAFYFSRHKEKIKPLLISLLIILWVWEFAVIIWDSYAGVVKGLDLSINLSLYPCSIFLYVLPFLIWGKGIWRKMACGYICTLGMLGALVNFLYPVARLTDYSCISFAGFHTFFFHGAMFFTFLLLIFCGYRYNEAETLKELFLPSMPGLIMSIPANLINYSPINADYMYFKGHFPLLAQTFPHATELRMTLVLYILYIFVPALFYMPHFLSCINSKNESEALEIEEFSEEQFYLSDILN